MLTIIASFISAALLVMSLTAVSNFLFFPRLQKPAATQSTPETPLISILVPARNEAAVIGRAVRSLLAQTYSNVELLVLDDNSEDGTGATAVAAANGDARFRLINGRSLPPTNKSAATLLCGITWWKT